MKPSNDREAIDLIIGGLLERGVHIIESVDGEGEALPFNPENVTESLDWLTSCDDSTLNVALPNGDTGWLYFVLGNDPEEVVCNCTVNVEPFVNPITDPWWQ